MIDPAQLALFSLAAGALVMAPRPDMLFVLGRALGQGRFAAFLATAERSLSSPTPAKPASPAQIRMLSFAGNLINPKVALFMFAASTLCGSLERRPRFVAGLNIGARVAFVLSGFRIATFEQPR